MTKVADNRSKFKIIRIMSDRVILINGGIFDGVEYGDILNVVENTDYEVTDPETGEFLGNIEYVKGTVCVEHAYEHMSVCVGRQRATGLNFFSSNVLNVDLTQITGTCDIENALIRVGDIVTMQRKNAERR